MAPFTVPDRAFAAFLAGVAGELVADALTYVTCRALESMGRRGYRQAGALLFVLALNGIGRRS